MITMRIGISAPLDNKSVLAFIPDKNDRKKITELCFADTAPAVNTQNQALLKAGHFIRIFTLAKSSFTVKAPKIEIYGVEKCSAYPVVYLWGCFVNASRLRKVMAGNVADLDVMHAHWTYEYAYAVTAFDMCLPVFCTVRDWTSYIWSMESVKNKVTFTFKLLMNSLVFRHRRIHFVANSDYMAALIRRKYNMEVPVIPNSVKDSFFADSEHVTSSPLTILCISSSNDKRKNVETLLRAFSIIIRKYNDAQLMLIGPPFVEGAAAVGKWKRQGLLPDNVILVGKTSHEDITGYLDACSVLAAPSREESFGNTLIEAMARKVPVVGGIRSGAVPYVLHGGKAGFLCDVDSCQRLAETIEYVYLNKKEADEIAYFGYRMAKEKYSEHSVCDRTVKLYQETIVDSQRSEQ